MSISGEITNIVSRHASIVADTTIAARTIALLIDDYRNSGLGFVAGVRQQVQQMTGPSVAEATVDRIFDSIITTFSLTERLHELPSPQRGLSGLSELYPRPHHPVPELSVCRDYDFTGSGLQTLLKDSLPRLRPGIIVEVGSWLGGSARIMADASQATIICVDTWLGSEEHQEGRAWMERESNRAEVLRRLWDQFIVNCFDLRDRIIPMRTTSIMALHRLSQFGVKPDVILLDGAHDAMSVACELELCRTLFPESTLILDDYTPTEKWLSGLVSTVNQFAAAHNQEIIIAEGNACMLAKW